MLQCQSRRKRHQIARTLYVFRLNGPMRDLQICTINLVVSTRSQEFAAIWSLSRCVSHLTVLFADEWGPDQRDREVDRSQVYLESSTGLSECGHLTIKPFAGSSSQADNPDT